MHSKHALIRLTIALVIIASAACICSFPAVDTGPSILGTWRGNYQGQYSVEFTFMNNGNFTLNYDGAVYDGRYVLDTTTNPARIDLNYSDGVKISSIIALIDSDTLRFENTDPGDPLPTGFDDYVDLDRVNP